MLIEKIYRKNPITIDPNSSINEALNEMISKQVNGIVVVDNNNRPIGILADQDIAAATVPSEFKHNPAMALAMVKKGFFKQMCDEIKNKKVKDLMRTDFLEINLSTSIMAVMADFLLKDLYIVPVVDSKNELIGIVTRTEIKNALHSQMNEAL